MIDTSEHSRPTHRQIQNRSQLSTVDLYNPDDVVAVQALQNRSISDRTFDIGWIVVEVKQADFETEVHRPTPVPITVSESKRYG
jgi:hypothetical protein